MSHFTAVATQIVSAKYLVQALRDFGYVEVEVHQEPQPLNEYFLVAIPNQQRAHVIVRMKGKGSGDIGFLRNAQGRFDFLVSPDDQHRFQEDWFSELTQRYAYHATRDMLHQQQFSMVNEERAGDGTIRLTLRRMT